jgi:uncharacterized membrane protein SpoIIM required for sporulation
LPPPLELDLTPWRSIDFNLNTHLSQPKPMLRSTAYWNLAIFFSLLFISSFGVNTASIYIRDSTSSRADQNPTLSPAAMAAPADVISFSIFLSMLQLMKSA